MIDSAVDLTLSGKLGSFYHICSFIAKILFQISIFTSLGY